MGKDITYLDEAAAGVAWRLSTDGAPAADRRAVFVPWLAGPDADGGAALLAASPRSSPPAIAPKSPLISCLID
jgi:hypothetical protein